MKKTWKKVVTALATAAMAVTLVPVNALAGPDTADYADGTAYLNINNSDWAEFEREDVDANVTSDGTYTVSMVAEEEQNLAQFNALEIVNGESVIGNGAIVTIDEIKLNGEAIELQGPSYTCSADGGGIITRVNLYNEWNSPVDDNGVPGDDVRAEVDPATTTACLWTAEQLEGVSSVEVTFTVSGFGTFKEVSEVEVEVAPAVEIDKDGVYHAFIGFQSPTYAFRNAWDGDDGYGHDTANFDHVTGWGAGNEELTLEGTFEDAEITGNGTYTVAARGLNFTTDDWSQDHMNLIFFSTDIPTTPDITFSDVELKVNGNNVDLGGVYVVSEDNTCLRVQIQNIWDSDHGIAEIAYYPTPVTELEITFTVSGFNYDNTAAEPAAEAAQAEAPAAAAEAPEAEESGSNAGAVAAGVAGVVVVGGAAAAIVAGKKKKK